MPRPRTTPAGGHVPVMLAEVLAALAPRPGHVAVDCTLGGGGHAAALLEAVGPAGRLLATDTDPAALGRAEPRLAAVGPNYVLRHANFAGLPGVLSELGATADVLLADLGVSSPQIDDPARGFSFARGGPLDMRMDPTRGRTAADVLNTLPEEALAAAFAEFGDEPRAAEIAREVVKSRPVMTTEEFVAIIERAAPVTVIKSPGAGPPRKQQMRPTTRVFQAVRILVNRELANLDQLLRVLPSVLSPGGTAVILTFHSGEDRRVKAAFRAGLESGTYSAASDEPVRPSEAEKLANPRSRSAKLRWATRAG